MTDAYVASVDLSIVEGHRKEIVKGTGISFAGNIAGKVLSFLLQVLIARGMGRSDYGIYALAESILAVFRLPASLGLNNGGILKLVAVYAGEEDMRRLKGVIVEALGLSLFSSVGFVALLFFLSSRLAVDIFREPGLVVPLRILSITLPFHVLLLMAAAVAQALRRMAYDAVLRSFLLPGANLAGAAVAMLLGLGLHGVVWYIVGATVLSALGSLWVLKRVVFGKLSQVTPMYSTKALLSVSLPVVLVSLSNVVSLQSDKLILGAFVDSANVGVYNAAFRIAWALQLILLSFGIFPPIVADLHHRGKIEELKELFSSTTRWIFSLMFPLFLIVVLFPRELMGVFGSEFVEGWPILVALSMLFLVDALTGQVGPVLRMTGNQRLECVINAAGALLNVLSSLILVRGYGALGVAVGTILALGLNKMAKIAAVYLVLGVHPYDRRFLRSGVIGLFGLAAVWVLRALHLMVPKGGVALVEASVLIGVYVGLGVLFFPDEDRATLRLILGRVVRRIRIG